MKTHLFFSAHVKRSDSKDGFHNVSYLDFQLYSSSPHNTC